ncbi:MAG: MBL fold metallo-hydrolase, partial [Pseudomonadota bacterium]
MSARYEVLVTGNALRLRDDFLGISSVVLVESPGHGRPRRTLVDAGGPTTRGSLKRALKDRGLGPGDIDAVFLSHLHFDHVWNLDL